MSAQSAARVIRLPPLPTIKDVIRLYRLRALRQLSQNFLLDLRITDKIVKCAGKIGNGQVCEVGPGPGGITRSILSRQPQRLVVIEKDARFLPALEHLAEATGNCMEIVLGDVMNFNMEKMFAEESRRAWEDGPPNVHLVGNLPFSVSTHLIIRWLEDIAERRSAWTYGRTRMTLTFQKEVAERMTAPINTPQRCRLTVMCQNWCKVEHKFTIPGSAFVPKPDVDVGVVCFTPLVKPVIQLPFKMVEKVVRCIFSYRQKYSIRGAQTLFPLAARVPYAQEMYDEADVDPTARPFQLTVEEFGRLCAAYSDLCNRDARLHSYDHRASKRDMEAWEDEGVEESQEKGEEGSRPGPCRGEHEGKEEKRGEGEATRSL